MPRHTLSALLSMALAFGSAINASPVTTAKTDAPEPTTTIYLHPDGSTHNKTIGPTPEYTYYTYIAVYNDQDCQSSQNLVYGLIGDSSTNQQQFGPYNPYNSWQGSIWQQSDHHSQVLQCYQGSSCFNGQQWLVTQSNQYCSAYHGNVFDKWLVTR